MKLIELHILQSFPVTCLNRDDVGSPKSATFGGSQRARVSSQSLKRAARIHLSQELKDPRFGGIRTRYLVFWIETELNDNAVGEDSKRKEIAEEVAKYLNKDLDSEDKRRVKTALFFSPLQIKAIVLAIGQQLATKGKLDIKAACAAGKAIPEDALDVALFGRMVASGPELTLEASTMFSHALSSHQTSNEIDFFAAVDEKLPDDMPVGAAHTGTLEYNSATYYRYVAINLDMLFDAKHLGPISEQEKRKSLLRAFITSVLIAVPGARQNSMNGATLPIEVLGIRKEKGLPLQLINAFEKPIKASNNGYAVNSRKEMLQHHADLKDLWSIETAVESLLTEDKLEGFLTKLLTADV